MRVLAYLIDIHRAAQDYQSVVPVETRHKVRMPLEINVFDPESGASEQRVQGSENLVCYMLKNQKFGHELWGLYIVWGIIN